MTEAIKVESGEGETSPQLIPVTPPPDGFVQTSNVAVVKDGEVLSPILWTNKTCSDWAPISVHHIRITRQRIQRPEWKDKVSIFHARPARPGKFILVGSSPYVTNYIEEIKELAKTPDCVVFAINSAVNLVLAHDIQLDGVVLFEGGPDKHVKKFNLPPPDTPNGQRLTAYMASWCHPHQWKAMEGYRVALWHGWSEVQAQLDEYYKFPSVRIKRLPTHSTRGGLSHDGCVEDWGIIGGGATTFTRTVNIGYVLGYRDFELFGFDSSFEKDGESHYVMSDVGKELPTINITPRDRRDGGLGPTFYCKPFMARQAHEFIAMLTSQTPGASPNPWRHYPYRMRMYGPGLLPWVHRKQFPEFYEDRA